MNNTTVMKVRSPLELWLYFVLISCLMLTSVGEAIAYDPEYGFSEEAEQQKAYRDYMQGLSLQRAGDLHNAVEYFRKSISSYPRIKQVHHELAKTLAMTGEIEQALAEFRTALNIDYNFVECRNNYGTFLKKTEKTNEAMREFKNCIQIDPKYPFPYYNLGLILHEKGDLEGAIENFEHATRLKPDFAEAYRELGLAIFERAAAGDLSEAAEKLEQAERLVPDNPLIHYHLGIIYCTKGNLDGGETQFRKALMHDPRFAAAHWELGKARYYRGDLERSLAELKEAEKINPTYTDSKRYPMVDPLKMKTLMAKAYEFRGDLIKAVDTYQQLIAMRKSDALYIKHVKELNQQIKKGLRNKNKKPLPYNPAEVEDYVLKGMEQYEDGDLEGAKISFTKALELNPNSFTAVLNLSFVQEVQNDLNAAVASCQKAIMLKPKFDGVVYNLAYLLEKMGLPDDAAMTYEKFRLLSGKYPYDPQHIIELQQNIIRQEKIEEAKRKRGY